METIIVSQDYATLPNKAADNFELQVLNDDINYESRVEWFEFKYKSEGKKNNLSFAIIHNLLTKSECEHYIHESERAGYTKLGAYQMSYRSNDRVIIISPKLSDLLFKRLSAYFPNPINHDGSLWEPIGLNEAFRFCRYDRGGTFQAHRDAYFARSANERSFITVNIYLNDTDGGCTRFLNPNGKKNIFQCQPQAGKALVFLHNEYHDGDVLRSNSKYLMRTDLIYRLKPDINPHEYCLKDTYMHPKQISENKQRLAKNLTVHRKNWSCSLQ